MNPLRLFLIAVIPLFFPLQADGGVVEDIFGEWQGPLSISTGMTAFSYPLGMGSLSSNPGWIGHIRRGFLVEFGPRGRVWEEQGHMAFSISPLGLEVRWLRYGDGREGTGVSLSGGGRYKDLGWGIRLKGAYLREEEGEVGWTADLGFGAVQEGVLRGIGVVVSNLFPPSISKIRHEALPASLLIGLCTSPSDKISVMAGIELKGRKEGVKGREIKGRLGMELDLPGPFKLRAGICDLGVSAGLGMDGMDIAALISPGPVLGRSFGISFYSRIPLPIHIPPKPAMERWERLDISGYDRIGLRIRSKADLLEISSSGEGRVVYDLAPVIRISPAGREAEVEVEQRSKGAKGIRVEIPDGVVLSSLELEVPEGRSVELDMGKLRVLQAKIKTRARETKISFGRRDPMDIAEETSLYIDAGSGDLSISGLGHAGFRRIVIRMSDGDVDLSFSGVPEVSQKARISVRKGRARIYIPPDLGISMDVGGLFGTIDIEGPFKKVGRYRYESTRYGVAPYKVDLGIDIILGSLKVESKR